MNVCLYGCNYRPDQNIEGGHTHAWGSLLPPSSQFSPMGSHAADFLHPGVVLPAFELDMNELPITPPADTGLSFSPSQPSSVPERPDAKIVAERKNE